MKSEKGMTIVEMTLIFPAVFFAVVVMLYFGLFKLQEAALLQMVQRVAMQGSNIAAYPGYSELGDYKSKNVDFSSIEESPAKKYYKAESGNPLAIYREFFGSNLGWNSREKIQGLFDEVKETAMIFPIATLIEEDAVNVKRTLLGDVVTVTVAIRVPVPAVIKYFIEDENFMVIKYSASAVATRPGGFVRDVDLAFDSVTYLAEKFGFEDKLDKVTELLDKGMDLLFGKVPERG